MQRLESPLKQNTKDYLTQELAPVLTEGLTRVGIARPEDPYLFLAQYFLEKSTQKDDYILAPKDKARHILLKDSGLPRPVGQGLHAARALSPRIDVVKNNPSVCVAPSKSNSKRPLSATATSEKVDDRVIELDAFIDGIPLKLHFILKESKGGFQVHATSRETSESYMFECTGVNFAKLRQHTHDDVSLAMKITSELSLLPDPKGCLILGLRE